MLANPPAALLVAEARRALERGLAPGFPQKVAANALGVAERELTLGPALIEEERARLAGLVGSEGSLAEANARLCAGIAEGSLDGEALVDHLVRTAIAGLTVDQPGYPAFQRWREGADR